MKDFKTIATGMRQCLVLSTILLGTVSAVADDQKLECKLYVSGSLQNETESSVTLEGAGLNLSSSRQSAYCVFADGSVADKQFVVLNRVIGDGATGSVLGYSVYSMQSGDSLSVEFTGGWGNDGFIGYYTVLGGSGAFENAAGDGTFTATQSPWATTGTFDVVLNITTP